MDFLPSIEFTMEVVPMYNFSAGFENRKCYVLAVSVGLCLPLLGYVILKHGNQSRTSVMAIPTG